MTGGHGGYPHGADDFQSKICMRHPGARATLIARSWSMFLGSKSNRLRAVDVRSLNSSNFDFLLRCVSPVLEGLGPWGRGHFAYDRFKIQIFKFCENAAPTGNLNLIAGGAKKARFFISNFACLLFIDKAMLD